MTESGRRVTGCTPHHRDHGWRAAYCSLLRGELVQAIGRGRDFLPEGIPVSVVRTEDLASPENPDRRNGVSIAD